MIRTPHARADAAWSHHVQMAKQVFNALRVAAFTCNSDMELIGASRQLRIAGVGSGGSWRV